MEQLGCSAHVQEGERNRGSSPVAWGGPGRQREAAQRARVRKRSSRSSELGWELSLAQLLSPGGFSSCLIFAVKKVSCFGPLSYALS